MMKNSMRFFDKCRRMAAVLTVCTCVCMYFLAGCSKDGDDPIENPNQPEKPVEVTLSLSTKDLAFEAKGGWKEFTINSSAAWTISGGNAWCQPGVTTGTGKTQVKVMVEAYTGTTDRNAVLTVRTGSLTVTLTVTQKAVHALTLTKDKFDVPQEGGDINIEVRSNINYTVSIPTTFQEWIKEAPKSKAMETKNFRFTVAANEEAEKREGYIVISGNELKDTVYVYQAEGRCLILDKDSCTLSAREQELTVELRTNVDYEVVVPDSVSGWISCRPESRALRTDKLRLLIGENGQEEERQAVVIVKDRNSELADTLHIRQNRANALILGQKIYDVPAEGGTLSVELTTNINYKVVIPDSVSGWVSRTPESRALRTDRLGFLIGENDLTKGRQAVVIIQDQDSELADTLHIRQLGKEKKTDITEQFDPDFARVLQEKGLIRDANAITKEEVEKIKGIGISQSGLTSLKGIEYFTALTSLGCENNQLTTLDVSKNTALTYLSCGGNKLTTLDISRCTALTRLECFINQLTTLDLSKNTELSWLNCSVNQLTNLDISECTKLTHFGCQHNPGNGTIFPLIAWFDENSTPSFMSNTILGWPSDDDKTVIEIQIIKAGSEDFPKTEHFLPFKANSTPIEFTVPTDWQASISYEGNVSGWLSISPTSGKAGTAKITASAKQNSADYERKAYINLTYGDKTQQITIKQVGGEENITDHFHPAFAQLLQDKKYIQDATYITAAEVSRITELIISNPKVKLTSMKGIKYLTELTKLDCSQNNITILDVSECTALTHLSCRINQLTILDVSGCTALTELNCGGNLLTELDINRNTALTNLSCGGNELTTLDVSRNTALTELNCSTNRLTALNVSRNTALTTLNCDGNPLGTLDVSQNTALTTLSCNGNKQWLSNGSWGYNGQLTTLNVSGCSALTSLSCNGNKLATLDVSQNTALTDLSCNDNQLTTLDVSQNTALTGLGCNDNQLTTLDVSQNTALTGLGCSNNQLSLLDISKNTALIGLNCKDNPGNGTTFLVLTWFNKNNIPDPLYNTLNKDSFILYNIEKEIKTEYLLPFCDNSTTIEFASPYAWKTSVSYEGNAFGWLSISPTSGKAGLVTINLYATRNSNDPERKAYIDITYRDETRRITVTQKEFKENFIERFDSNFIRILQEKGYIQDITAFTEDEAKKIKEIDVSSSKLTSLEGIEYFTALTNLDCHDNQLTTLDISKNTALTCLKCHDNKLTELNVIKNTKLVDLRCNNNIISTLDVSQNINLQTLNCSNNNISEILLNNCTNILYLECQNNKISGILDLNNHAKLIELNCANNKITKLDVSSNTELTSLVCANNKITKLNLLQNTKLTTLNCSYNLLTTLDMSGYWNDLNGCWRLTDLNCSSNQLTNLNISKCSILTNLNCAKNQLTNLDLYGNDKLTNLTCEDNPGSGYTFQCRSSMIHQQGAIPPGLQYSADWTYNGLKVRVYFVL